MFLGISSSKWTDGWRGNTVYQTDAPPHYYQCNICKHIRGAYKTIKHSTGFLNPPEFIRIQKQRALDLFILFQKLGTIRHFVFKVRQKYFAHCAGWHHSSTGSLYPQQRARPRTHPTYTPNQQKGTQTGINDLPSS